MRWLVVPAGLVYLAGCRGPEELECSIRCGDDGSCPSGLTCSAGFCGETSCEPAFEEVSAGGGYACALDQFHRPWCWGGNDDRQIIDSDEIAFPRAFVAGERRWSSLSTGGGHTCAIDSGELWCWGKNDRNQVTSTITGDVPNPIRIEVDGQTVTWTKVAAGFDYTCAIGDHHVYCWGAGAAGKLGNGSPDDVERPRLISGTFDDWIDIAAGLRHTCAVSKSHGTWCWGDGSFGQLGNGKLNVKLEPQSVDLPDAIRIAVGLESTCAVRATGDLVCWGRAAAGALGDPGVIDPAGANHPTPVVATAFGGWVEVVAAERYACGRRDDGSVYCWGTAKAGGIADGVWQHDRAFVRVIEAGATSIALGWNGTSSDAGADEANLDLGCAVVDGGVQCWGDNRSGQLGQGTASRALAPTAIAGGHAFTQLTAGIAHACGLADGAAYCWGSVERGQVAGIAAGRDQPCTADACDVTAPQWIAEGDDLAVGTNHACATHGAALTCWGDSRLGQCGKSALGAVAPDVVPGTWSGIHADGNATCSVETSGTVEMWCWGRGVTEHGPAPEPDLEATPIDLAFGDDFGCQLAADHTLACFGDDSGGVFGNGALGTCGDGTCNAGETAASCAQDCGPAPLSHLGRSYARIAIGHGAFACGIRLDGKVECWGDNAFAECGTFDVQPVIEPTEIATIGNCTDVAAGRHHACAVCDGTAYCWGDARHGELGGAAEPVQVIQPRATAAPDSERFAGITAGDGFTCARTDTGHAYCWGSSVHGALGNGGRGANLPVAVRLEGSD